MQSRKRTDDGLDKDVAAIYVPIEDVHRSDLNPRGKVNPEDVSDLAASIAKHGIMQPIVVDFHCNIIAGERRYVAAQVVGLAQVPVIFRDTKSDQETSELALIENIQREDLKPITEAKAYADLMERGLSVDQIAERTGIRRDKIYRMLKLLKLPSDVQDAVENQTLSIQAGIALLQVEDAEKQKTIASKAVAENMTADAIRQEIGLKPRRDIPQKRSLSEQRSIVVNHAIDKIEAAKVMLEPLRGFGESAGRLADIERRLRMAVVDLGKVQDIIVDTLIAQNKKR